MNNTYRFFIMTTDPVHIGTGGMRLGRVDNTIVREPGTNLPKIPGTALHGAIRMYAARRYGKPQCAGQKGHCGQPTCPICYTFGSIEGEAGSFSGVVSIGDARILLFPVYSMVGPVWVTSPTALFDAGYGKKDGEGKLEPVEVDKNENGFARWKFSSPDSINLGWLMVKKEEGWPNGLPSQLPQQIPEQIRNHIVLVSDKLFSQIVNSNLEVRTSVAINPETGAAEEGALYTYEAISRATILWFDVIVDDFRGNFPSKNVWVNICKDRGICDESGKPKTEMTLPSEIPESETDIEKLLRKLGYIGQRPGKRDDETDEDFEKRRQEYWKKAQKSFESFKQALGLSWERPLDIIEFSVEWAEHLGIGGMGTRGFGRIKTLCWKANSDNQSVKQCSEPEEMSDSNKDSKKKGEQNG